MVCLHRRRGDPDRSTAMTSTLTPDKLLNDDPQTVARLDSLACLFHWMQSLPTADRKRFLARLAECSDAVQQVVIKLLGVLKSPDTTPAERKRALSTIDDALFINPDDTDGGYGLDLAGSEPYV